MAKKETEKESFLADSSVDDKKENLLLEDDFKTKKEESVEEVKINREEESIEKTKEKKPKKKENEKTKEAKPIFARIPGAKTCPECGSKRLTDTDGSFKCAIGNKDCSFIK